MKHTLIAVSAAITLACLAGCTATREGVQKDTGAILEKLLPAPEPTPAPAPATALLGVKTYKALEK